MQTRTEPGTRATRHRGNPAAAWSIVSAVIGTLVAALVILAPALPPDAPVVGSLVANIPDVLAAGLFGSVPALGLLAILLGSVGVRRARDGARRGWMAVIGIFLGLLLLGLAIGILITLVRATRTGP